MARSTRRRFSLTRWVLGLMFLGLLGSSLGDRSESTASRLAATRPAERSRSHEAPSITAADVYWDDRTRPHKGEIVALLNKVRRENKRCTKMDLGTVMRSGKRGTAQDPVWFVTCEDRKGQVFNVFFAAKDLADHRVLSGVRHAPRAQAVSSCEQAARARAEHPGTVEFSRVLHLGAHEHPNGNTTIESRFIAENALGAKVAFGIRCLVLPSGRVDHAEVWRSG